MTSLRAGVPDGSGGCIVSPDGSVIGLGGGTDCKVDKIDRQCLTGGSCAASASAFDLRSGIRTAVSSGLRGIGSCRM
jgi:hypothetical protein